MTKTKKTIYSAILCTIMTLCLALGVMFTAMPMVAHAYGEVTYEGTISWTDYTYDWPETISFKADGENVTSITINGVVCDNATYDGLTDSDGLYCFYVQDIDYGESKIALMEACSTWSSATYTFSEVAQDESYGTYRGVAGDTVTSMFIGGLPYEFTISEEGLILKDHAGNSHTLPLFEKREIDYQYVSDDDGEAYYNPDINCLSYSNVETTVEFTTQKIDDNWQQNTDILYDWLDKSNKIDTNSGKYTPDSTSAFVKARALAGNVFTNPTGFTQSDIDYNTRRLYDAYMGLKEVAVSYVDENGQTQTATSYTEINSDGTDRVSWTGTVCVTADATLSGGVTMIGDTILILSDGVTLTVQNGIDGDKVLTICGQAQSNGVFNVTGKYGSGEAGGNGITGNVVINGCMVTLIGGSASQQSQQFEDGYVGGDGVKGNLTVNGGTVTIKGAKGGAALKSMSPVSGKGGNGVTGNVAVNGGTATFVAGDAGDSGMNRPAGLPVAQGNTISVTGEGVAYLHAGLGGGGGSTSLQVPFEGDPSVISAVIETSYDNSTYLPWDGETELRTFDYLKLTAPIPSHTHGEGDEAVTFEKAITTVKELIDLFTNGGSGYLANDITLTEEVNLLIPIRKTVSLCLSGHVLNLNGNGHIYAQSKGETFSLYDCGTTEHYFTVGDDGLWTLTDTKTDKTKTVVGGVLTGNGEVAAISLDAEDNVVSIYGGTICGNKGGAVRATSLYMYGGTICGNMVDSGFAAVRATGVNVQISGKSVIKDNFDSDGNQINLMSLYGIIADLEEGADVGLTPSIVKGLPVIFADEASAGYLSVDDTVNTSLKSFVIADLPEEGYPALVCEMLVEALDPAPETCLMIVDNPHVHDMGTPNDKTDDITFDTAIDSYDELAVLFGETGGSGYLTKDIICEEGLEVDMEVNLCLNGHVIRYVGEENSSVITINSGATLNLYDCGTTKHNGYVDANGLWHYDSTGTHELLKGETAKTITGGIITGGTGTTTTKGTVGGGVYIYGGEVTMNGGTICGNTAAQYGGGVFVASGSFTMNGGAVSDNTATSYGGGVSVFGGKFDMDGGTISGNYGAAGGGVMINSGVTFTMTDGTIQNNKAGNTGGGGVMCNTSSTMKMSGGTISGNITTGNGGGIYNLGALTMTGGTITGNSGGGGGVLNYGGYGTITLGGTAKITGNTLSDGTASNLYLLNTTITLGTREHCEDCNDTGICQVCGGNKEISCRDCDGNGFVNCETCGGSGIHCDECNSTGFTSCYYCHGTGKDGLEACDVCEGTGWLTCWSCDGDPVCQACDGSKKTDCGICCGSGFEVCYGCEGTGFCEWCVLGNGVLAPTENMNVGITLANGTGAFTIVGISADYSANFFSDNENYKVLFNAGTDADGDEYLELAPIPSHTHGEGDEAVTFTAWKDATQLPEEAGNYYLDTDVTLTATWTVPQGTTNLCLNGHVINANGGAFSVITVNTGATLNLYDCDLDKETPTTHNGYVDANGLWHLGTGSGTAKDIIGGIITGGNEHFGGGVYICGGSFTMNAGTIVGNQVYGDSVYGYGGGVCVDVDFDSGYEGYFVMNGGVIAYNTASSDGAGVCVGISYFTMNDGIIENNIASRNGGGVYVNTYKVEMTGGKITNNMASNGGGVYANGEVILGGSAQITDNALSDGTASNLYLLNTTITLGTREHCENCGDTGLCSVCGGDGKHRTCHGSGCPMCGGSGICTACRGDGTCKYCVLGNGVWTPTEDMNVGITLSAKTGAFTIVGISADYSANFFSDDESYKVLFNAGTDADGDEYLELKAYVAQIDETIYFTLEEAVEEVENEGTIILLADVDEEIEISKEITFSIDAGDFTNSAVITAGEGYKLSTEVSGTVTTYKVEKLVAQIGDEKYTSLADAIDEVEDGETITLLADNEEEIEISKIITFSIDAGEFTNSATITAGDGYDVASSTEDTTTEYVVRKLVAIPTAEDGLVFNGETQTGVAPSEDDSYTLTGNTGTNADDYEATATLADTTKYLWEDESTDAKTIAWSIAKADNTISDLTIEDWVEGKTAKEPSATATDGTPVFTYSTEENGEYVATVPTTAGRYWVKASVAESDNYNEASEKLQFEIRKASIKPSGEEEQKVILDTEEGFSDDITVTVEVTVETEVESKISEEKLTDYSKIEGENKLADYERISVVFDVKLIRTVGGVPSEIQPSDIKPGTKINVKILIPDNVDITKVTRILHVHSADDIESFPFDPAKVDGHRYYTITIDRFSELAFIYNATSDLDVLRSDYLMSVYETVIQLKGDGYAVSYNEESDDFGIKTLAEATNETAIRNAYVACLAKLDAHIDSIDAYRETAITTISEYAETMEVIVTADYLTFLETIRTTAKIDAAVETVKAEIDDVVAKKAELYSALDDLDNAIDSVSGAVGDNATAIADVKTAVGEIKAILNDSTNGLAKINLNVAGVKTDVLAAIATLKSDLVTELGNQVGALKNYIDALEDKLNTQFTNVGTAISTAETNVKDLINLETDDIDTAISTLTSNVSTFESNMTTAIATLKSDLVTELGTQVGVLKAYIDTLEGKLDTKFTETKTVIATAETNVKDLINLETGDIDSAIETLSTKVGTVETNLTVALTTLSNTLKGYIDEKVAEINTSITTLGTTANSNYSDIVNKINEVNSLVQSTKEIVSATSDENATNLSALIANTEKAVNDSHNALNAKIIANQQDTTNNINGKFTAVLIIVSVICALAIVTLVFVVLKKKDNKD